MKPTAPSSSHKSYAATPLTIKRVKVDAAASGDNTLVAAVAGKQIQLASIWLRAAGTVSIKFKSGSTDLTGSMILTNAGTFTPPGFNTGAGDETFCPPAFQTASDQAFIL